MVTYELLINLKRSICLFSLIFLDIYQDSTALSAGKPEKCENPPDDPSLTRRPGDGNFEIRVELLPSGGSTIQGLFSTANQSSGYVSEYYPGREYEITITQKSNPTINHIMSAYVIAVPVDSTESQEFQMARGSFYPTMCNSKQIGWIEYGYNFPDQTSFSWTAPHDAQIIWNTNVCLEIRVLIIPNDWRRIYYRNTGSLSRTLCRVKDLRRINNWPNSDPADYGIVNSTNKQIPDQLKIRSISEKNEQLGDGFNSDGGYHPVNDDGGCSMQDTPKPVRRCCACNTAIYRLVIQSDWQQQQHWQDWPTNAGTTGGYSGSPHFSEILGASHSEKYNIFYAGGLASAAVDAMCTTSDVSKLEDEFLNKAGENILNVIRTRSIDSQAPPEQRIRSALFAVNSTHHLISFLTRLVPSTDWCTGLSNIDMCLPNCSWPHELTFDLEPWDAGVISGNTYVPIEQPERLRQPKPMCSITPDSRPNTPFTVVIDNPLNRFNERRRPGVGINEQMLTMQHRLSAQNARSHRRFVRLGTAKMELLRVNQDEACSSEITQDDQAVGQEETSIGQRQCKLSSWSKWGVCTRVDPLTCPTSKLKSYWSKQPAMMERTRFIMPPSTATECAGFLLKERKECDKPVAKSKCTSTSEAGSEPSLTTLSIEECQSKPWGAWSSCVNATCVRPGWAWRWRKFESNEMKDACKHYPSVVQLDTCWPPPGMKCDRSELQGACLEQKPSAERMCVAKLEVVQRYYYDPIKQNCETFSYVAECHVHALYAGHKIGWTRNMFHTYSNCQQLCMKGSSYRRAQRSASVCAQPMDSGGVECANSSEEKRWYYDTTIKQCVQFVFKGCGGNGNNFITLHECINICRETPE